MRAAAAQALERLDASARVRRALRAGPPRGDLRDYVPGQCVFFWKANSAKSSHKGRRSRQFD
eukprot:11569821-Alexandrium_andersonii.AAC.1